MEETMTNKHSKLWLILSLLVVSSLACSLFTGAVNKTAENPASTGSEKAVTATAEPAAKPVGPTPTPPADVYAPAFASYPDIPVNIPAAYGGKGSYTLPVDLSKVKGVANIPLTDAQKKMLSENGFVAVPGEGDTFREFYQVYENGRYDGTVPFVTTDAIYHSYHLLFDKMLRDLEKTFFINDLKFLTDTMRTASQSQLDALKGTPLEEPAKRNLAFFAVAGKLLGDGNEVPGDVKDMVAAELALIEKHDGQAVSPIWDRADLPEEQKLIEDYTQYVPRGHYTKSEELKMYFKAMMWYGRLTFRLRDDFETRRALLLVQALRTAQSPDGATPAVTLWQNIYDPTVFIVGKSDDLSYVEYGKLSDTVFGPTPDLKSFADEGLFAKFMEGAKNLPPPKVNSMWVWITEDKEQATKGFRFMGQRFTLDQYVFGQVIWREVGTDSEPRALPKALDLPAAMGSEEAYNLLKDMGETKYENYDKQLSKVKGEIATLDKDTWTQNLYWSWLYSFFPLIEPKGEAYPVFMQNPAWTHKDLNTTLGSWTELKHDTILYAKQVMAEMGGGGPDEEPPHGWVEPNPEAYARLNALTQMTLNGLTSRNLVTDWSRNTFTNLSSELTFLQKAAEKELAGEKLSTEDYWHIIYYGGILEQFAVNSADADDEYGRDISDINSALVADVASGPAPDGMGVVALTEAVGYPVPVYVVLPDEPWRIAIGAVYSYYEFTVPSANRMTDEQWQQKLKNGEAPELPAWTGSFTSAN
jgi:hypothetical protein